MTRKEEAAGGGPIFRFFLFRVYYVYVSSFAEKSKTGNRDEQFQARMKKWKWRVERKSSDSDGPVLGDSPGLEAAVTVCGNLCTEQNVQK